jgi:glycerol uptake facilitator-like aquaporin
MHSQLRPYLAELIGTFAVVLVGAGAVCAARVPIAPGGPQPLLASLTGIALAQGFVYAVFLSATVNVSGGYLNPAVTLMLWVFKRLDTGRTCWLLAAQLLGAALAGAAIRLLFSEEILREVHLGTPHLTRAFGNLNESRAWVSGVGVEMVLTFLLTFAIFGTMLDPRAPRLGGLGPGLAVTALVLLGFHLTGAGMNPARWFGTVIWEPTVSTLRPDLFVDILANLVGPVAGALLAGAVYTLLILPSAPGHRTATDDPATVGTTAVKAKK